MILCVDVEYGEHAVSTACVALDAWSDAVAQFEFVLKHEQAAQPYEPGEFYKRELPFVLEALRSVDMPITAVVIDGYVWLGNERPGFGARLYEALDSRVPVVGVAKNRFHGATPALVLRGESDKPLYVTAAGIELSQAADAVRRMHGEHRVPTMLKHVDRLSRGLEQPRKSRP